jgi:hypothetical protein
MSEREFFSIEPIRVHHETEKAVLVKLEIAGAEHPKEVWLEKFRVQCQASYDGAGNFMWDNVTEIDKYLDQKYGRIIMQQPIINAVRNGKEVSFENLTEEEVDAMIEESERAYHEKTDKSKEQKEQEEEAYFAREYEREKAEMVELDEESPVPQKTGEQIRAENYVQMLNRKRLDGIEKNVPTEMKSLPNWCIFKIRKDEKGDYKKRMLDVKTGRWADYTRSETWATFDVALKYARDNNGAGLAFALKGTGITCVDLDGCYDRAAGQYNDVAKNILPIVQNTFVERSVSGTGMHVFVKDGDLLENGKYNMKHFTESGKPDVEVMEKQWFVSMTGDMISKSNSLSACPQDVKNLIHSYVGEKQKVQVQPQERRVSSWSKSDEQVIAGIERSRASYDFHAMMRGELIFRNDHSATEMKLLGLLSYATDKDEFQMGRIFRSSRLYRSDKDNGKYYERKIGQCTGRIPKGMEP